MVESHPKVEYKPKNIDCNKIKPHVEELILRCGSPEATAEYIGIGTSTLYRIRHNEHCTMQIRTAQLIMDGLVRRRKEDRKNGISEAYLRMKQQQALSEKRMKMGYFEE